MRIRSYLLKEQLQLQFTEHHFVYFYEVMINCYPNFITCLYFSLALIRWNSSHCQLMELFKSKENFKEKVDLGNNWKTAWPRIILEWHPFLRLSLGLSRLSILSFAGKHLIFYPKKCLFIFCIFYSNEEITQQVCLIKYIENDISDSNSHKKKKKKKRGAKLLMKNFHSLH